MAISHDDGEKERKKKTTKPEKLLQKRPTHRPRIPKQDKVGCRNQEKPTRKRKKAIVEGPGSNIKISVLERMKEVQSSLSTDFPTLVRPMLPSHVAGCFWLGLSKQFCARHLPKEDTDIILEDESGCKHETRYLWQKTGLSGGWRAFAVDHKLQEGDAVIFHLVEPTKFKVYIVRKSEFDEVDGAHSRHGLDPSSKKASLEINTAASRRENSSDHKLEISSADPCLPEQPEHEGADIFAEALDEIRLSESINDFKDGTGREDFAVVVNGVVIDSELPKHIQAKYNELCCSRKSILHEKLLQGLNSKLAIGMVSETVNIADAMRASKITTSIEDFTIWGKTLKAFKDMGMDVGFLLDRLDQLMNLAIKSNRIKDARMKRAAAEEEMNVLEAKVLEVRSTLNELDAELNALDKNGKGFDEIFCEISAAPW